MRKRWFLQLLRRRVFVILLLVVQGLVLIGLICNAGRLAQWAAGYRTMADILADGEAEALEEAFATGLDRLGTCPCYIVDEY